MHDDVLLGLLGGEAFGALADDLAAAQRPPLEALLTGAAATALGHVDAHTRLRSAPGVLRRTSRCAVLPRKGDACDAATGCLDSVCVDGVCADRPSRAIAPGDPCPTAPGVDYCVHGCDGASGTCRFPPNRPEGEICWDDTVCAPSLSCRLASSGGRRGCYRSCGD